MAQSADQSDATPQYWRDNELVSARANHDERSVFDFVGNSSAEEEGLAHRCTLLLSTVVSTRLDQAPSLEVEEGNGHVHLTREIENLARLPVSTEQHIPIDALLVSTSLRFTSTSTCSCRKIHNQAH
jgi:hypothetical protein